MKREVPVRAEDEREYIEFVSARRPCCIAPRI
jgi:hypothetical protein